MWNLKQIFRNPIKIFVAALVISSVLFSEAEAPGGDNRLDSEASMAPSGVAQVVLNDPLNKGTKGKRCGGQFVEGGGWQVTGAEDMIVFDLGRYIENGSVELEVRNFRPRKQNTYYRHHLLSMFTNPWGNHNPVEDVETLWDLHTGTNYDDGVKMLSWTYNSSEEKNTILPDAWENDGPHHLKIIWRDNQLQYFRNGRLWLTHTHRSAMQLRFLFLGRDLTVSGDFVTNFKHNQYPALVGPIYSNLIVKENGIAEDQSPPQIEYPAATDIYANAARLAWTTDEPAVCYVEYGLTPQYNRQTPILGLPGQEFTTTLDQLLPNQTYHYRIIAIDNAGNRKATDDSTFSTLSNGLYLFKPLADTYVEMPGLYGMTRDHANFGWMNLMTGRGRECYLRFQVKDVSGEIAKTTLRLHARKATAGQVAVHSLGQRWEENEVTWRTKPGVNEEILGSLNNVNTGRWHEITLNADIKGDGMQDFAILSSTRHLISFDSRESTNFQPELIVETKGFAPAEKIASEIFENFDQNFLDVNKWLLGSNSGNLSRIVNQALKLRSMDLQSGWIITREAFVARNKMATVKIVQPNNDGNLGISPTYTLRSPLGIYDERNWYRFYVHRSTSTGPYRLYVAWKKGGVHDEREVTGNLAIRGRIYLRIRCDERYIHFEASFDGKSWAEVHGETFSLPGYTLDDPFHFEMAAFSTSAKGVMTVDDFAVTKSNMTSSEPPVTYAALCVDNFDNGVLDSDHWLRGNNDGNRAAVMNQALELRSTDAETSWLITRKTFVARNTTVTMKVEQPNDDGDLGMSPTYTLYSAHGIFDEPNWYRFYTYRNSANGPYLLYAAWRKNGASGGKDVTGSLIIEDQVYLRLRFDEEKIYFEASLDGTSWLTTYSESFSLPDYRLKDAFHYELAGYNTESRGMFVVDDFVILAGSDTSASPSKMSPTTPPAQPAEHVPSTFALQNYPNPFNASTHISFEMPEAAEVDLKAFDATGRLVRVLQSATLAAGKHEVIWDGKSNDSYELSSGIYFVNLRYRIENSASWSQLVRRVIILR